MDNKTCSLEPGSLETLKWGQFMDLYFDKMAKCMRDYIDYQNSIISSAYINEVRTKQNLGEFCGNKDSYRHPDGLQGFCSRIDPAAAKEKLKNAESMIKVAEEIESVTKKGFESRQSDLKDTKETIDRYKREIIQYRKEAESTKNKNHRKSLLEKATGNEQELPKLEEKVKPLERRLQTALEFVKQKKDDVDRAREIYLEALNIVKETDVSSIRDNSAPFLDIICNSIKVKKEESGFVFGAPQTEQDVNSDILNKYNKQGDDNSLNLEILNFILKPYKDLYYQFSNLYQHNSLEFYKAFFFYIVPIFYFDIENIKKGILDNTIFKQLIDQKHLIPDGFYQVIQKQLTIKESPNQQPFEVLKFICKFIVINIINLATEYQRFDLIKFYNQVNDLTFEIAVEIMVKLLFEKTGLRSGVEYSFEAAKHAPTAIINAAKDAVSNVATAVRNSASNGSKRVRGRVDEMSDPPEDNTLAADLGVEVPQVAEPQALPGHYNFANYEHSGGNPLIENLQSKIRDIRLISLTDFIGHLLIWFGITIPGLPNINTLERFYSSVPNMNILGIYGTQLLYDLVPNIFKELPKNDLILSFFQVLSQNCANDLKVPITENTKNYKEVNIKVSKCFKKTIDLIFQDSFKFILSQPIPVIEDLKFDRSEVSTTISNIITNFFFPESVIDKLQKALVDEHLISKDDIANGVLNVIIEDKPFFENSTTLLEDYDAFLTSLNIESDTSTLSVDGIELLKRKKVPLIKYAKKRALNTEYNEAKRIYDKIVSIIKLKTGTDPQPKLIKQIMIVSKKLFEKKSVSKEMGSMIDNIKNSIKSLNIVPFELMTPFEQTFNIIKVVSIQFTESLGLELFYLQFFGAFYTALSDPTSKLYKSIASKNIIAILVSLVQLFKTNLPTTVHKVLQMVDPIIKATEFGPAYVYWFGPKLIYPSMGPIEVDIIQNQLIKKESKGIVRLGDRLKIASVGQVYKLKVIRTEDLLTKIFQEFDNLMIGNVNYPYLNNEFKKYLYTTKLIELKSKTIEILTVDLPNLSKNVISFYDCVLADLSQMSLGSGNPLNEFLIFIVKIMKKYNKDVDIDILYGLGDVSKSEWNKQINNYLERDFLQANFNLVDYISFFKHLISLVDSLLTMHSFKQEFSNCLNAKKYDLSVFKLELINLLRKVEKCNSDSELFTKELDLAKINLIELKYGLEKNLIPQIPVIYNLINNLILNPHQLDEFVIKFIKIRNRMMMCLEKQIFPGSISQIIRTEILLEIPELTEDEIDKINNPNTDIFVLDTKFGLRIKSDKIDAYNYLLMAYKLLNCKIADVLDEFDLWEEITNTMKASKLYSFNDNYSEPGINFRIITADVKKTFEHIEGFQPKPVYVDEHGEIFDVIGLSNEAILYGLEEKIIFQKKHYTAIIQTLLPGNDIVDIIDDIKNYSEKQRDCLHQAYNYFIMQFLNGIVHSGRYHGDPHGGNLKWNYNSEYEKGTFSVLDFGDFPEISKKYRLLVMGLVCGGALTFMMNEKNKMYMLSYITDFILNSYGFQNYTLAELEATYKLNIDSEYFPTDIKSLEHETNQKFILIKAIKNYFEHEIKNAIELKYRNIKKSIDIFESVTIFTQDEKFIDTLIGKIEVHDDVCETVSADIKRVIQALIKLFGTARIIGIDYVSILINFIKVNSLSLGDNGKQIYDMLNLLQGPIRMFKFLKKTTDMTTLQICNFAFKTFIFIPSIAASLTSWTFLTLAFAGYEYVTSSGTATAAASCAAVVSSGISLSAIATYAAIGAGAGAFVGGILYYVQRNRTEELVNQSVDQLLSIQTKSTIELFMSSLVNTLCFIIFDGLTSGELAEIIKYFKDIVFSENAIAKVGTESESSKYVWDSSLYPQQMTGFGNLFISLLTVASTILSPLPSISIGLNKKIFHTLDWGFKMFYLDYSKIMSIGSHKENTKSMTDPSMTNIIKYKKMLSNKDISTDKYLLNSDSILYVKTSIQNSLQYEDCLNMLEKYKSYILNPTKTIQIEEDDIQKLKFRFVNIINKQDIQLEEVLMSIVELSKEEKTYTENTGTVVIDDVVKSEEEQLAIKRERVSESFTFWSRSDTNRNQSESIQFLRSIIFHIAYFNQIYKQLRLCITNLEVVYKQKKLYQENCIIKIVMLYHFMKLKKTIYPDILYSCLVELSTFANKNTIQNGENLIFSETKSPTPKTTDFNLASSLVHLQDVSFLEGFDLTFDFWQFDFRELLINHFDIESTNIQAKAAAEENIKIIQSVCSYLETISSSKIKELLTDGNLCDLKDKWSTKDAAKYFSIDKNFSFFYNVNNCLIVCNQQINYSFFFIPITLWDDFSYLLSKVINVQFPITDECKITIPENKQSFKYQMIVDKMNDKTVDELHNLRRLINEQIIKHDGHFKEKLKKYKQRLMDYIIYLNCNYDDKSLLSKLKSRWDESDRVDKQEADRIAAVKQKEADEKQKLDNLKKEMRQLINDPNNEDLQRTAANAAKELAVQTSYLDYGPTLSGQKPDEKNRDDIIIEIREVVSDEKINGKGGIDPIYTTQNLPYLFTEILPRKDKRPLQTITYKVITANGRELTKEELDNVDFDKFLYKNALLGAKKTAVNQAIVPEKRYTTQKLAKKLNVDARAAIFGDVYANEDDEEEEKPTSWAPSFGSRKGGRKSKRINRQQHQKRSTRGNLPPQT
jgi:hypothetical protein